jgi:DNA-binding MarR family transcriptional regulator
MCIDNICIYINFVQQLKMKLEEAIKQKMFKTEDERLVINMVYTSGWLNAEQARYFKQFGISPEQYNVLRILRGQQPNPASVSLIQERMLDKMSNASRLIEKLKQKEFVERNACPNDRRQVDVKITDKGMKLLAQIDSEADLMHAICKSLTQQEKETLNTLLDKFRN